MEFDCTKPLEEHLEEYLEDSINDICTELSLQGIVFESQFVKLWSMVCKQNAQQLVDLFSEKLRCRIWYAYDNITCNFVFFDMDKYSSKEAIDSSVYYQSQNHDY